MSSALSRARKSQPKATTGKSPGNLEQIKVGDLVWARNEFTGQEGFKPVVTLFQNTTETLVHLTYTSGAGCQPATLTGTPGHPFWSVDHQAWVGMHELQPGETLLITTGRTATVTATRTEYLTTPVKIYNFEVADWHTYHVGSPDTGWVFVHNKNGCGGIGPVRKGRSGEARVRAKYDIGPATKSKIKAPSGNKRIPDGVNKKAKTLSEVKNSKYVSLTPQLTDELAIARRN